jgi:dihydrolipoamide dehydrogenase
MQEFDLVVIGGGPAGYVGAIRAAQLGMKVACVEQRSTLGGTCLNVGCIPSKALLNSSEKYHDLTHNFAKFGINAKAELDLKVMMQNKDQIVNDLTKGISGLFAKNKITRFIGSGMIISKNIVEVPGEKGDEQIGAKNILIATGSEVTKLPNINIDEKKIVSSTGALALESVPKNLVVVGAGVIGLELGSVWSRLGSKVRVIEFFDRILPMLDLDVASNFQKILEKQGIEFKLSTKVSAITERSEVLELSIESADGATKEMIEADVVLVAVGRKPNTAGLGLENVGISINERGFINIDGHYRTKESNIYAVGDVTPGPMLAHKAEEEAVAAVEIIAGQRGHVNYNVIPSVIYTSPEVASVGKTEDELKKAGIAYKVGKFPFLANSRARAINNIDGLVKIIADSVTDEILGAQIIGPEAGNMIHELIIAMEFKAASEDVARSCHAHPTLNEAIKEACLAVDKRTINM